MLANSFRRQIRSTSRTVLAVAGYSIWSLGAVFGIGAIVGGAIYYVGAEQLGFGDMNGVVAQMAVSILVYVIGATVLLIEPYAIRRLSWVKIRELTGIMRLPRPADAGYAVIAWAAYMIVTVLLSMAAAQWLSWIDLQQSQDVGFQPHSSSRESIAAALVIVVAAPLVEEFVFRGYLFGSIRRYVPWWLTAVVVSVLFGLVHGQWNVGIDTFALSMVLCYVRERTGSIWAGVMVHALKNSLAFYILFLAPDWLRNLLMSA